MQSVKIFFIMLIDFYCCLLFLLQVWENWESWEVLESWKVWEDGSPGKSWEAKFVGNPLGSQLPVS